MRNRRRIGRILSVLLIVMLLLPFFEKTAKAETINVTGTYYQTDARKTLDLLNSFRTGDNAWYWNESNTEKIYVSGLCKLS